VAAHEAVPEPHVPGHLLRQLMGQPRRLSPSFGDLGSLSELALVLLALPQPCRTTLPAVWSHENLEQIRSGRTASGVKLNLKLGAPALTRAGHTAQKCCCPRYLELGSAVVEQASAVEDLDDASSRHAVVLIGESNRGGGAAVAPTNRLRYEEARR
jgi:hypothetical protein